MTLNSVITYIKFKTGSTLTSSQSNSYEMIFLYFSATYFLQSLLLKMNGQTHKAVHPDSSVGNRPSFNTTIPPFINLSERIYFSFQLKWETQMLSISSKVDEKVRSTKESKRSKTYWDYLDFCDVSQVIFFRLLLILFFLRLSLYKIALSQSKA